MKNSLCKKNTEIEHSSQGCIDTPATLKLINASSGLVNLLRSNGTIETPFAYPAGSLDLLATIPRGMERDYNVNYHFSPLNARGCDKKNSSYSVKLFDAHNIQVTPGSSSAHPGYHLQLFSNNKQVAEVTPSSRPVIISTVPGGVIIVKITNPVINIGQPGTPEQPLYPIPGQPEQPGIPGQPEQFFPIQPGQPPNIPGTPGQPEQFFPVQPGQPPNPGVGTPGQPPNPGVGIASTGTGLNEANVNAFSQNLRDMQYQFMSLSDNLGNSINNLNQSLQQVNTTEKNNKTLWIWIGVGVAAIVVILLIGFLIYFFMKGKNNITETVTTTMPSETVVTETIDM